MGSSSSGRPKTEIEVLSSATSSISRTSNNLDLASFDDSNDNIADPLDDEQTYVNYIVKIRPDLSESAGDENKAPPSTEGEEEAHPSNIQ